MEECKPLKIATNWRSPGCGLHWSGLALVFPKVRWQPRGESKDKIHTGISVMFFARIKDTNSTNYAKPTSTLGIQQGACLTMEIWYSTRKNFALICLYNHLKTWSSWPLCMHTACAHCNCVTNHPKEKAGVARNGKMENRLKIHGFPFGSVPKNRAPDPIWRQKRGRRSRWCLTQSSSCKM